MKLKSSSSKITLILSIVVLLGMLAGCANTSPIPSDAASSAQPEATAQPETTASDSDQTLVFWNIAFETVDEDGVIPDEELALNKAIEIFEDNTGMTVEVVNQGYDNYLTLFRSAGMSQSGPDVVHLHAGTFTTDYAEFIEPLDSYFTDDEIADFPDLSLCRVDQSADGALLGIPHDVTTLNLFYNRRIFEEAGVDPDADIKTFAELEIACEKIVEAGYVPFSIADADGSATTWVMCEFLSDKIGPERIYDFKDATLNVASPEFVDAMTVWTEFAQKALENGWCNADAFTNTGDARSEFWAGKTAMTLGGSWWCGTTYSELSEDAGTMPIPAASADDPYIDYICSQFSGNIVVTSYSPKKEAAVEFLKVLTSPAIQTTYYENGAGLPPRLTLDIANSENADPLSLKSYSWIQNNKNVVGFDSIINANVAEEFYRLAPVAAMGDMTVAEFVEKVGEKE